MVGTVVETYVKGLLSSGEVVLIETRQHWIAAVRFVLRPILLVLAAVALALLNQWLKFSEDSFLSFVNDLVHWTIVILLIVAIVWLPIDLVRWWSRRYILTNRRSMYLQGVLRKSSFDASLEQINDIGMMQSFLGRTLGYADLTLFTASDQANPTYDQLMDGPQFKRAVMDAKEAIRAGAPLEALPEGFIVKGGTNEASMRADGKIAEAAEVVAEREVGPAAGAAAAGVAGAAVSEAVPPPEPVAAPEPQAEAAPVAAEPVVTQEPQVAQPIVIPEPQVEQIVEAPPAPALVIEPTPEPMPEPQPMPEQAAWPAAEVAPATEPEWEVEPEPEVELEPAAWPAADVAPATEPEREVEPEPEPEPEPEVEPESEHELAAWQAEPTPVLQPEVEPEPEPETGPEDEVAADDDRPA
jgi:membrane protein YdbS with pleckstrin-like domain